ncbi:MAG: TetR/AcrR family transcriptional regulator [Acidimicrobiales bacterium]
MSAEPRGADAGADVGTDGRNARRQRNRDAAVDAMLSLIDSGSLAPTMSEVAVAAGLSPRSLFRYFDDIEDLVRSAVARQQERLAPLAAVSVDPGAPLADRVRSVVAQRMRAIEAMGHVGRVARLRAHEQPAIRAELARQRRALRRDLASAFSAELADRPAPEARAILAAVEVLCSYESHELMCADQGLTGSEAADAVACALDALLAPRGSP